MTTTDRAVSEIQFSTVPATMRAVTFLAYGSPDVLRVAEVPTPTLTPDGVLIRVEAAGVNPADDAIRGGALRAFARLKFPFIPGADVAGVAVAVGAQVTTIQPGDRVYAMLSNLAGGGCAEYAVAPAAFVARLPPTLSMTAAAGVPLAALTALQGLRDLLQIRAGESLLINGASGGVGSFAVQIAKAMGARVTAVVSTRNLEFARELGADVVIDYSEGEVINRAERYARIFDAVGVYPFSAWRRVLTAEGVVLTVNPLFGNPIAKLIARLRGKQRLASFLVAPSGSDLAQISAWIEAGSVRPFIERTYSLDQTADAHRAISSKRTRGKLVITTR